MSPIINHNTHRLKKVRYRAAAWKEIMTHESVYLILEQRAQLIADSAEADLAGVRVPSPFPSHFTVKRARKRGKSRRARVKVRAATQAANELDQQTAVLARSLNAGMGDIH